MEPPAQSQTVFHRCSLRVLKRESTYEVERTLQIVNKRKTRSSIRWRSKLQNSFVVLAHLERTTFRWFTSRWVGNVRIAAVYMRTRCVPTIHNRVSSPVTYDPTRNKCLTYLRRELVAHVSADLQINQRNLYLTNLRNDVIKASIQWRKLCGVPVPIPNGASILSFWEE